MCRRKKTAGYNKKDYAASPIVATESVIITATVDAHEGQYMATFDTPGAYLHTETD